MSNGNCPNCGISLDGGSIWEHFFKETGSESEADRIAEMYGATRENNKQWGRMFAIYHREKDRSTHYKCADCNHVWEAA